MACLQREDKVCKLLENLQTQDALSIGVPLASFSLKKSVCVCRLCKSGLKVILWKTATSGAWNGL